MKLNSATQVLGSKTLLVPYRINHVKKYHKWMGSFEVLTKTASERLSLQEEYVMQQTWLHDDEKCTFIVLDKELMERTGNEIESMIGDVNLFLKKEDDLLCAEISLMIAEIAFRNAGRGKETALNMLRFGVEEIGVKRFYAVVIRDNVESNNLFKKLHFSQDSVSEVFNETTYVRNVDEEWTTWLIQNTSCYELGATEPNK